MTTGRSRAVLLGDYLDLWRASPFDWSTANCCHFAAGWVRLIEGRNPLAGREVFDGLRGVAIAVRDFGGLREAVTQLLGRAPIEPALAQVGDLLFVPTGAAGAVGLCNGRTVALLGEGGGVLHVEIGQALCAWEVGAMKRPRLTRIAVAVLALLPAAVGADPVSIGLSIAGSWASAAGYTAWAVAFAAASVVYGSAQARRKARRQAARSRAEYNASLEDRSVTALRSLPAWRIVYGRCISGGDVVAIFTTDKTGTRTDGSSYTKPDALKHLVVQVATHEVQAINEIYVDGVPVGTLDGNGEPTGGEFYSTRTVTREITIASGGSSTQPYAVTVLSSWQSSSISGSGDSLAAGSYTLTSGNTVINNTAGTEIRVSFTMVEPLKAIRIQKALGTDTQTVNTYLNGLIPTQWTSNHRLRGIAYVVVTLDLEDARFQGGPPGLTFDVSGRKVLDTRTSTTAWSANPALIVRDFLCSPWGYDCAAGDIDVTLCNAAANACDALISLTIGGTTTTNQPTFTCNGSFTTDESREAILEELLESMAGAAVYGGTWAILAGAWTSHVMDLGDEDLDGQIEFLQADHGVDEIANGVRGTYIPIGKATPQEFDTYQNATFVTADGDEYWEDLSLSFVDNKARARNLVRIRLERLRSGQVIRYPAKLKAWPLQAGDRVRVTSAEYGLTNKTYRVTDWQFGLTSPVLLTLQEDDATIYDLADAATADPTPNTDLPNPYLVAALTGVTVASGSANQQRLEDGTLISRVKVSWNAVTGAYLTDGTGWIYVTWRRQGFDPANTWNTIRVPASEVHTYIPNVTVGNPLTIGVWAENGLRARGSPVWVFHTVTGDVASVGGGNLLRNSSFEVDSNGDGLADAWVQFSAGSTGSVTKSLATAVKSHGTYSQQVNAAALGTSGADAIGVRYDYTDAAQLVGKAVQVAADVQGVNIDELVVYVAAYNGGSFLQVFTRTVTGLAGKQRVAAGFTVPASTTILYIHWWGQKATSAGAATVYVDAATLTVGAVPVEYAPREDEILAGQVGTPELANEAATRVQIASSTSGTGVPAPTGGSSSDVRSSQTYTNNIGVTCPVQIEGGCDVLTWSWDLNVNPVPTVGKLSLRYSSTSLGTVTRTIFDLAASEYIFGNGPGSVVIVDQVDLPAGETITVELLFELTHDDLAVMGNGARNYTRISAIKR